MGNLCAFYFLNEMKSVEKSELIATLNVAHTTDAFKEEKASFPKLYNEAAYFQIVKKPVST